MRLNRRGFMGAGVACLLGIASLAGCAGRDDKSGVTQATTAPVTDAPISVAKPPAAGQPAAGDSFRFVVYGDTRDGHAVHRKLVELIVKQKPDFVLQTGDLVHNGAKASLWKIYDSITEPMRSRMPVYPSRGNHDMGGPGYEQHVTAPFTSGNKLYYSFNKGTSHFIALDIDEVTRYDAGSRQYRWLEKDLAEYQSKAKSIFIFFHVPPYSVGSHGSDKDVRAALCPLFIKYGVRAVFNGHDHLYYHTLRDGVHYIVAGGGGAPLYPVNPDRGLITGDKAESVNNIVVVDVRPDKTECVALRADGSQIERFTLP